MDCENDCSRNINVTELPTITPWNHSSANAPPRDQESSHPIFSNRGMDNSKISSGGCGRFNGDLYCSSINPLPIHESDPSFPNRGTNNMDGFNGASYDLHSFSANAPLPRQESDPIFPTGGMMNSNMCGGGGFNRASDLLLVVSMYAEPTKSEIIALAESAMDELSKIAMEGQPLWVPQKDKKFETLNDIEYLRQFGEVQEIESMKEIMKLVEVGQEESSSSQYLLPTVDSFGRELVPLSLSGVPKEALQTEASRDMGYLDISSTKLLHLLMDVNQWSKAFDNIVTRAAVLGTLSNGAEESYDGKVQVMFAEYHLPTPFVPSRECYFARYCKQLPYEMWGVVDVSLEKHFPSLATNFRRRPSGCLIRPMPDGFSKVIWVEHVEADHSQLSNHFRPLVTTGLGFGATRWINSIIKHTESSKIMEAKSAPIYVDYGVIIPQAGRTSFLNLADRLVRTFCGDINASMTNQWMPLISSESDSSDVRVMIRNNIEDPGKPIATTVVFSTCLWLKVSPSRLFNFLRHEDSRNKWDILSRNLTIREFAYMNKGTNPGNRVSLMRAMKSEDKIEIFYIQESYIDTTGSYIVYAPLDEFALSSLANGANPNKVMVLPSGFSILPCGFPSDYIDEKGEGGSILTIAFHTIESHNIKQFFSLESVIVMKNIISDTVTSIKDAVLYNNYTNNWQYN
ncbi:homeobox-leucine zipper protein ROC2-like [Arachis stenosperma]|uniref:homeobox-leucine zipper protein ROC2-like n=1 Tax=Arachis stenosperma TaxID=217475 RepID=UPI0025AD20EF|nr:homeobox-leucine zipper protein ROC2-like [Arachis stenosperma]